jgi:endoglucanase
MAKFKLNKGINISHWLSQVTDWMLRDKFFTRWDVEQIASYGFDHIRIPIDEENLWTEDGEAINENFDYLEECLSWCKEFNLNAIVDLHVLRAHHFNAANDEGEMTLWDDPVAQNNFIEIWERLSKKLKHHSNENVAYELLNEPVAPNPNDWNKLIQASVKTIRNTEPNRTIIIGSNNWQSAAEFPHLFVPEEDENIILSVHIYDPIPFTHYKSYWTPLINYTGSVKYPGWAIEKGDVEADLPSKFPRTAEFIDNYNGNFNKEKLQAVLQPAIDKTARLNLSLYCGEFGCLPSVDREMRLCYYKELIEVFEENNIACAAWDYKGDFGVQDYDRGSSKNLTVDYELLKLLTKK